MKCPRCQGTGEIVVVESDCQLCGYVVPEYENDGLCDVKLGTFKWFVNKLAKRGDIQPQQKILDQQKGFLTFNDAEQDMCNKYKKYSNFKCMD